MKKSITDSLPEKKSEYVMVNIKCKPPELYKKLQAKLKKKKTTVRDFFETCAKMYLDEK